LIVTLRNFIDTDANLLILYLNDDNVTKYITDAIPQPYTESDAHWWINNFRDSEYIKAIEYEGRLVGCISANKGDYEYSCGAELGYWIGSAFWNKGIATEAIRIFSKLLLKNTQLVRLFVSVVSDNIASIRVLEKNDYCHEGILKKASFKNNQYYDEYLLAKIST